MLEVKELTFCVTVAQYTRTEITAFIRISNESFMTTNNTRLRSLRQ